MRCFIAINIDEKIRKALAKLQNELQGKADVKKSDVKWVNPETIHLTLKFLGEIKDEQIVDVCNCGVTVGYDIGKILKSEQAAILYFHINTMWCRCEIVLHVERSQAYFFKMRVKSIARFQCLVRLAVDLWCVTNGYRPAKSTTEITDDNWILKRTFGGGHDS